MKFVPKLILFILFCLPVFSFAQDAIKENLKLKELNQLKTSYKKQIKKKNYGYSVRIAERMLHVAKGVYGEENPQLVDYYNYLGTSYYHTKKYSKSLQQFESSYKINSNHSTKDELIFAKDFLNLGKAHFKLKEYDKAIQFLEKSLDIRIRQLGDSHSTVAIIYDMMGSIYEIKGENDRALDFYQKSLSTELKALNSMKN